MDNLLRFARQVFESVLSQLAQQFNVVQEMALAPMRLMIQQVVGGIWIGDGADAFVEEVSSLMIPGVGRVADDITVFSNNLRSARDVIEQADETVDQLVKSRLMDVFDFF